jgi:hypothetical protein
MEISQGNSFFRYFYLIKAKMSFFKCFFLFSLYKIREQEGIPGPACMGGRQVVCGNSGRIEVVGKGVGG